MKLQLSLKKKWFEMTKSGIKTEDYREITPYWVKRLIGGVLDEEIEDIVKELNQGSKDYLVYFKDFIINRMTLGYPKRDDKERIIEFENAGIEIRKGNPEWGAEPDKLYFVIKHGKEIN